MLRTMRKLLLTTALLLLSNHALLAQSTPPYPDTSATGTVPQMIQKLTLARSALDGVEKTVIANQQDLDSLNAQQEATKADGSKLIFQSKKLVDDFNSKIKGFNAACGHRMREESVEYTDCLHSQTDLVHLKEDLERQNTQWLQDLDAIKQKYVKGTLQQALYQTNLRNLTNWKSQVEPGIRSLEAAISSKCKPLGNCPAS
jgi:hypothetical protein